VPDFSLVTFNAHAGVHPYRISVPRLRSPSGHRSGGPFDLVRVLVELAADVIVVEEAYRPDEGPCAFDEAARALGFDVHEVAFGRAVVEPWPHLVWRGDATGTKGIAVLTRFPVRARREIDVLRVPLDPAADRRALCLELDVGGRMVDLVALHLTSRLPYGPPVQLMRIRRHLPDAGRAAVLTGDFNFWGPPVSLLLPGWRRAVRGRTWPAHRPHSQIDHVLVRDGVEPVETAILPNAGSDHRPVRVTLRVE
jgi:endonuclease/exonuclease/phosphatase family metal-dependent hydrolase